MKAIPVHIIRLAQRLAEKSTMKYKLSAIIFNNKYQVINTGYNRWLLVGHREKIPFRTSIHAEADAIIGTSRQDLYGSSILVFRKNFGLARPCRNCQNMINAAGIRKIYYSSEGTIKQL